MMESKAITVGLLLLMFINGLLAYSQGYRKGSQAEQHRVNDNSYHDDLI